MAPIFELLCRGCGHTWEEYYSIHDFERPACPHCESKRTELLPVAIGGYKIKGNNNASTRPKSSGSFKKGN